MSKKVQKNNKQNIKTKKKLTEHQKKMIQIGIFSVSIILLVLALILILKFSNRAKSETQTVMDNFYEYYEAKENKVIFYYNSSNSEDYTGSYELNYLIQIGKDYKIDYFVVDSALLNDKNRLEVESSLGIKGTSPTTVVVNNKSVVAVQEGFIESNKLVDFLVSAKVLEKGSLYKPVDNLKFINYEDYLNILSNKKRNIVVMGQSGCEYCMTAKPILNNISKGYSLDIYYLDLSDLKRDEVTELFSKLPELGYNNDGLQQNNSFPTPTLLIIDNGKVTSYLDNVITLEEYVSFLKENKFIE